jgi:hypothetical protein
MAQSNLATELRRLRQLGATADGAVGDPDPMKAIEKTLAQRRFEEIILSTLPPGISRWLAWDLPHRVRARTDVPLTVITSLIRAPNDPVRGAQQEPHLKQCFKQEVGCPKERLLCPPNQPYLNPLLSPEQRVDLLLGMSFEDEAGSCFTVRLAWVRAAL